MRERRELAELEVFITRDVVVSTNSREHLGLLDRIDAEVGLEVEIQVEHVGRIVGRLGHNSNHHLFDVVGSCRRGRCLDNNRFRHIPRRRCFHRSDRLRRSQRLYRSTLRRSLVPHAQAPVLDFELGVVVTAEFGEPRVPASPIGDTIVVTELIGIAPASVRRRHPADERHRQLRTEASSEAQCVLYGVAAAGRQVQAPELRIDFLIVRYGRHDTGLKRLDCNDVFDAGAHRVSREALRVGDHDLVSLVAEYRAQCEDFGRRAAAARWRIRLVRHEHRLRCQLFTRDAVLAFGFRDQLFHDGRYVVDIEPCTMECAVCRDRTQHLGDRLQASFPRRVCGLHDERSGAHTRDHAVATPVERRCRILRVLVGRRST